MLKNLSTIFCLISLSLFSQKTIITATVTNNENGALVGNVFLLDTLGHLVSGDYFENGQIQLTTDYKGRARLQLNVLGYEEFTLDLVVQSELQNLGRLSMKTRSADLTEIEIVAKKPVFERTSEGTRVNIHESMLSKSANALELLGKIPTVNINANKVTVFGRGEALLIMNGKEITLESFKSLPPADIQSIELITNPDARYDAKGKAVIIITMLKHFSQGTAVVFVSNTTLGLVKNKAIGAYTINSPNVSLNFRKKKWDLSSYYGNELGTNWSENNFITSVSDFTKYGYYTEDNHNQSVHYYRAGLGYQINENSAVSAQYDGLSHFLKLDVQQNGDFYRDKELVSKIRMRNDASTRLLNHSANLNYFNTFNAGKSKLFIGGQFNQFQNTLLDQISELIDSISYQRINHNLNRIYLYTFQADYNQTLPKGSLDVGVKFSHTSNQGNIRFYSKKPDEEQFVSNQYSANNTIYEEYIPALYGLYKRKWQKTTVNVGLRWEQTLASSQSMLYNIQYFRNQYANFFPSAGLHYTFNSNWKVQTSFSSKINRPLYQDMDPFLWYLDSLTSIRGNAQLKPEYLNQVELRGIYKSFVLRYGYTLSKQTIASVMMSNSISAGPQAVVFTKDNIQQRNLHTVAFECPFEKGKYSSFTTVAFNLYQFIDKRSEYKALAASPQLYIYTYQTISLPVGFNIEFSGEFYGSSFDGFTKRKPYYYFTLALSRTCLKNKALHVNLMWNDFMRTALWAGSFRANTFTNTYSQRFMSHYVRLTLTYNLASRTTFNYRNKNVNEAEFNRIKK